MRWRLPFSKNRSNVSLKVLVTGSRGKSSIVRLVHTALKSAGLQSYARITGVIPRELTPSGVNTISRSAGAHVEEMRWWLKQLPASAQAIVMENSAISPDFQILAERWLQPDITVLSNILADHQESWGPSDACAAEVLLRGIPRTGRVILPSALKADRHILNLLESRQCQTFFTDPVPAIKQAFHATNIGLALATVTELGLNPQAAMQAMREMPQDDHDFKVINFAGAKLAMAFSANDISSTQNLFASLQWPEQETRLIYNHRRDRPERFKSFIDWLNLSAWREVLIIGDRPRMHHCSARHLRVRSKQDLRRLFKPGERVFGCGNIAGLPLSITLDNAH
jgi:poly-gamma-glutamate synthase PgsB/CapB